MNYQNSKLVIICFLILIIYLIYDKKCENFTNLIKTSNKYYGYNNLTSGSSPGRVYNREKITELESILNQIIVQINKQTNNNFYLGDIENITFRQQPDNSLNYVIDFYLFERDKDYTFKTLLNFTILPNKKIQVNNITRGNAFKYDFNNYKLNEHPHLFNHKLSHSSNFKTKYTITGIPDTKLHFSITDVENIIPRPLEHDKDILPLYTENDKLFKKEENRKFMLKNCSKELGCWDTNGIRNQNPHHNTCNVFQKSQVPILDSLQPQFNSSIHKNLGDKKRDEWLFSPTRLEIDHNL